MAGKNTDIPSAFTLIESAKAVYLRNPKTFQWLVIGPMALCALYGLADSGNAFLRLIGNLFYFAGVVAAIMAEPGLFLTTFASLKNKSVEPKPTFKAGLKFFWRYIGLAIMLGLIFGLSFLLLIVPFFFMLPRYILAPYYMVDRNLGVFAALRASAEGSKNRKGPIWGLIGVSLLVTVAGWIAVGIVIAILSWLITSITGLSSFAMVLIGILTYIFVIPLSYVLTVMPVIRYRQLVKEA